MGITFALRGDSLTARYAPSGAEPLGIMPQSALAPAVVADATSINGSNSISFVEGGSTGRCLMYRGNLNIPATRTWSILVRAKLANVGNNALVMTGYMGRAYFGNMGFAINNATSVSYTITPETNAPDTNSNTVSTISASTWYDFVMTFDNTQSPLTRDAEFFINASSQFTDAMARDLPDTSTADTRKYNVPYIFFSDNSATADINLDGYIDEVVIWDEIIDPTSVTLTSGSGSLNGSSRTAYVDVSAFDGGFDGAGSGGGGSTNIGPAFFGK